MKLQTIPFKEKGSLRLNFIVIYLLLLTFSGKEINTRSVYRIQWLTGYSLPAKRATKTLITSINRYGKNKKKEQDDYKQIANCIKDENSGHATIPVNIYM